MQEVKKGLVVKIISDRYTVLINGVEYLAKARGKLRLSGNIVVGDIVDIQVEKPFSNISKVHPRKNLLLRPFVANIDMVIIVIAKEPAPDLLLVDKIIVDSRFKDITPVICYNKSDMATSQEIAQLLEIYKEVDSIITSAITAEGAKALKEKIANNIVCFAGQSATGKSSILNMLLGLNLKTGELSEKLRRGKHTTRHVELFRAFDGMIVDTCGFSKLDLVGIHPEDLKNYYDDFFEFSNECKYTSCLHIAEPDCAVKRAVELGSIDKDRYLRYINIYNELSNARTNHV
ncbi:MAG: ribosome small subunit-dependent GTPase A [Christensenellaceae bacterium]|jgi:ribosome biogenesis GTPase|nr:ribosome small subunit-dependent GTPase A [Christensenellaceae bacterium]